MDEILAKEKDYTIWRRGRFLAVELLTPHRVLSTSAQGGGQREDLRYLVNHQSCEGSGHDARFLRRRLRALCNAVWSGRSGRGEIWSPKAGWALLRTRKAAVPATCLAPASLSRRFVWRLWRWRRGCCGIMAFSINR